MAPPTLRALSSMATRQILEALSARGGDLSSQPWTLESTGGVDAARRVAAGEAFDLVFLAVDALQRLAHEGHVVAASVRPLMTSEVSVAVPRGADRPVLTDAAAVRAAVRAAASVAVSTGPSGVALLQRFKAWGLTEALGDRLKQAPPGVPVGLLVGRGEVALGFQQTSELLGLPGIDILGPLPPDMQIVTAFGGAVGAASRCPQRALAVLECLASPSVHDVIRQGGMVPASHPTASPVAPSARAWQP